MFLLIVHNFWRDSTQQSLAADMHMHALSTAFPKVTSPVVFFFFGMSQHVTTVARW